MGEAYRFRFLKRRGPAATMKRLHLLISGRVQGVCFRAAARRQAGMLGLTGYARNLPDGRVEIVAEGPEEALKSLRRWAGRGPAGARVDDLAGSWSEPEKTFSAFEIGW